MNRFRNYIEVIILTSLTIFICYTLLNYFVISKEGWNFQNTGQIGDTFAGITSPIIGLFSAILIYLSFKEQLQANNLQKKALDTEIKRSNVLKELEQITDLIEEVKDRISQLQYITRRGEDILRFYYEQKIPAVDIHYKNCLKNLNSIISLGRFIADKTMSFNFEIRDERVIYEKLDIIFSEEFFEDIDNFLIVINENDESDANLRFLIYKKQIILAKNIIFRYLVHVNNKIQDDMRNQASKIIM